MVNREDRQTSRYLSGSPLPGTHWHMMSWSACDFVRAAHGHDQALRMWPPKWRVSRTAEDTGSSSRGRCRGRQYLCDDRRPCFSHRVSSVCGVTSVHGRQHINDVTSRQWELTTRISWVCLHPIPNSFLPRKVSLVPMRSRINYKHPILIQWFPAILRSISPPCLNYVWTRFC